MAEVFGAARRAALEVGSETSYDFDPAGTSRLGVSSTTLTYVSLPALIERKLAAGRMQDQADVVKLIQVNPDQMAAIREHLSGVHPDYAAKFERLAQRAGDEADGAN